VHLPGLVEKQLKFKIHVNRILCQEDEITFVDYGAFRFTLFFADALNRTTGYIWDLMLKHQKKDNRPRRGSNSQP
jgi:hypothetical protein